MAGSRLNRRGFLKTATALGAYGVLVHNPLSALAKGSFTKVSILHTNDWHSRIEPFPMDGGKFQGLGGASTRAAVIKKIREQEEHVLLLDAGDIFQGTPYFNFFDGELEYKLMSAMGYDAVTFGNHDFDNGIEGIINQSRNATFPFINCNYDVSKTLLSDKVKPYKVFKKGGVKIGVLGVGIDLNGLVPEELWGGIVYNDPVSNANRIAAYLKEEEKCSLVICLSHLGYKYNDQKVSDVVLARSSKNIDLIIGGHTHTFLPEPVKEKNAEGKEVMINQVGWAGINLGRIDYYFEPITKQQTHASGSIVNIVHDKC